MRKGIVLGIAFLSLVFALSIVSVQASDPLKCNETDGGTNYFTKGVVLWESPSHQVYSYIDTCLNSEMLGEFYCQDSNVRQINYNCSGNYGECYDGTCVKCSSESDSGNSPYVRGSVILLNSSVVTDYCVDNMHLQEYVCSSNEFQKYVYPCPVCRLGQCLFCTDSDNGKDYATKGDVKVNFPAGQITSYNDRCDGNTLTEYYCENGLVQSETVRCSPSCDIDSGICLNPCIPKTCQQLGRDCGSWDAGCGVTRDCGGDCIGANAAQPAQSSAEQAQPTAQTPSGTTPPAQQPAEVKPQSGESNDVARNNDDATAAKDASQPTKKGTAPKSKWEVLGIILIINNILGAIIALITTAMLLKSIYKKNRQRKKGQKEGKG